MRETTEAEERRVQAQVDEWMARVVWDYARAMDGGDGAVLVIGRTRFVVRDRELQPGD